MFQAFPGVTLQDYCTYVLPQPGELAWGGRIFKITVRICSQHNATLPWVSSHYLRSSSAPCLHHSSSAVSPCHLLSRRSSLSRIQAGTVKCFQIGKSRTKGRNGPYYFNPSAERWGALRPRRHLFVKYPPDASMFLLSDQNSHACRGSEEFWVQNRSANVSHF